MTTTKQPLITIEGKDSQKKNAIGILQNVKSPTKLYFDAEDFKGKELPKKGELRCGNCGHQNHFLKDCPLCECENNKPFRLSSDAVLKSVGDVWNLDIFSRLEKMRMKNRFYYKNKIVIAEGYYE
ncbi:MAG: hypothetical protein AABY15_08385 [Nanoarchaeota archaeon]